MTYAGHVETAEPFVASARDFERAVNTYGLVFWRGFVLGALSLATITYPILATALS